MNDASIRSSTCRWIRSASRSAELAAFGSAYVGIGSLARRRRPRARRWLVLDVLQLGLAEIVDADALGQVVADERAGRLREEDLAAVASRADPRRADDVQPEVALVADRRLAGVQAHPHAHRGAVAATRGSRARAGRRPRRATASRARWEGEEERVALRVDLASAGRAETSRTIRRCSRDDLAVARRRARWSSFVEPSMSVKTNVTVPAGSELTRAFCRDEPPRRRDQPLSAPACGKPRRLVPVGRPGALPRAGRGPADPAFDRLQRLPLVPRDGARVVRGQRDGGRDERALRQRQGRSRGTARPGRRSTWTPSSP